MFSLRRALASLTLVLVSNCAVFASKTIDVYIIAGQSNADGRGLVSDLTGPLSAYASPQPAIRLYYVNPTNGDPLNPTHRPGWVDLAPGYSVGPGFSGALPSDRFGFELSLGQALAAHDPSRSIAFIKVSRGGTNLAHDWDPDGTANFMWQTLARSVPIALATLTANGDQARVRGVFWHQGESDGGNPAYQADLTRFISATRTLLGKPDLPFALGELERDHTTPTVTGRSYQLTAMAAVAAADPHTLLVPSAGLGTYDGTHFTSSAYITLGERFATAMHARLDRSYVVTFSAQGGSAATPATIMVSYDRAYGPLPSTVRAGHAVLGWFTAPDGGARVTPETVVSLAADHTLHARWSALPSITGLVPATVLLDTFQPWTPARLSPSAAAWFDASDATTLTLSGAAVAVWADKSGRANHAVQSNSSLRPSIGIANLGVLPTISFRIGDGTQKQFLSAAHHASLNLDTSGGANVFAVFRHLGFADNGSSSVNAPLAKGNMLLADSAYGIRLGNSQALGFKAGTDALLNVSSPDSANQPLLFAGTRDDYSHTAALHLNGSPALFSPRSAAIVSDNSSPLLIGRDPSSSRYTNIDFGEILLVGGALSPSARQQIEGYLAHKWDLAAALPSTHPHKVLPPGDWVASASLVPVVTDPEGDPLTHLWSLVSGPAPVSFGDAFSASTTATFISAGVYTLRLTSSDGAGSVSGDIQVTVRSTAASDAFAAWAADSTDAAAVTFAGDANQDGIADGLAWLLGATTPDSPARSLLPVARMEDQKVVLDFTLLGPEQRGPFVLKIQYSEDLSAWTSVFVPDESETQGIVSFSVTPEGQTRRVRADISLPAVDAANPRLFVRLLGENP